MSGVIKAKRNISSMQFYQTARELRRDITKMSERMFSDESKFTHSKSLEYYLHTEMLDILGRLIESIVRANEIFPTSLEELEERKRLQNKAIGLTFTLEQQLEYLIDLHPEIIRQAVLYTNKIDYEIRLLRKWKQTSNKLRKGIIQKTIQEIEKELREKVMDKLKNEILNELKEG